ncbi:polysaccharide export protein [Candidatus Sumerlaeota bacterium]|nr:polysaccharide export protein [Candidatus Sumerlaeota bacterium]
MSHLRLPPLKRALFAASLSFIIATLAGCATRGQSSRYIPAPEDPRREQVEASINEVIRSPELQLPSVQEYYLGPGDVITLTMVGRDDVFPVNKESGGLYTVTVTENPLITLPYIGSIKVHGKTAGQLQEELRVAYSQYIQNPIPIVTVEKFYYNQVSVLGAVRMPARYPLLFGDTLLDAIFRAGGLTFGRETGGPPPGRFLKIYREKLTPKDRANMPLEELLTRIKEGDRVLPRRELIIPIEDFINEGELSYNIPLHPNDVVYIPSAGTVMVQGPVMSPGVVFLGPSIRTLTQALTEKGGLRFGAASRVEVVRTPARGEPVSYFLNSRRMLRRHQADFLLQDGDQIFVYVHPTRMFLENASKIFRSSINAGASATYNPL